MNKKLMGVVALVVAVVAGVSVFTMTRDSVYRVWQTPQYKATFYTSECANPKVKSQIPAEQLQVLGGKLKKGVVVLQTEVRDFCYVIVESTAEGEVAVVIDEKGAGGPIFMSPKE